MDANAQLRSQDIKTLQRAALIAGLSVLFMALTVPFVEFYIFPSLIDYNNPVKTFENLKRHPRWLSVAILVHFMTVVCDIVAAWALYIFLKPANQNLALLTAWFRVLNGAFTVAALSNLLQIMPIIDKDGLLHFSQATEAYNAIFLKLRSFNLQWRFMLVFFSIYLGLLGILLLKATYVPKVVSVLVLVSGFGYLVDNLKYFFYPDLDIGILWFTYFGEVIFTLWLLIKGSRIRKIS